jgi:tRNA dimethylallyltransferase
MPKTVFVIAGPTASGKSDLALHLANQMQGEIVNADSMQLYRDLTILTARPSETETTNISHHLYGVLNHNQLSTAAWWANQATQTIDDILERNKTPIIVGGTGLYLKTLMQGISTIPEITPLIRKQARTQAQHFFGESFYEYVCTIDPSVIGKILPSDRQRLTRALEVFLQTNQSIFSFHEAHTTYQPKYRFFSILLLPPREQLYERINQRFLKMLEQNAIQEVQHFNTLNIDSTSPLYKAIGVRELSSFLKNDIDLPTAIELAKRNSRHYAKRQITWFRHQFKADIICSDSDYAPVLNVLKNLPST